MFENYLYFIDTQTINDTRIIADLSLFSGHAIFKGHFPGQPVLPGACMLQIVKELVQNYAGNKVQLKKAGNLKFLSFIDPSVDKHFHAELNITDAGEIINVDARFMNNKTTFFKFTGTFNIVSL